MKKMLSIFAVFALVSSLAVTAAESRLENYVNKKLAPVTQKEKELNSKIEAQQKANEAKAVKGRGPGIGDFLGARYEDLTERIIYVQFEVIKKLAEKSSCVIIGRCADYILKDREGNIIAQKETSASETKVTFEIENVHLWHGKKDPYLYSAEVCLKENDEIFSRNTN